MEGWNAEMRSKKTQQREEREMKVCDFLKLCGEAIDVELVDYQSGEAVIIDTESFIVDGCGEDEWVDDIVSHTVKGWTIRHGRLSIEY